MKTKDLITLFQTNPIASEPYENGSSNNYYTNYVVETYVSIDIENSKVKTIFEIKEKMFGKETIFETCSIDELKNWIEEHKNELQEQINSKK